LEGILRHAFYVIEQPMLLLCISRDKQLPAEHFFWVTPLNRRQHHQNKRWADSAVYTCAASLGANLPDSIALWAAMR
jgi:hypothetical protein